MRISEDSKTLFQVLNWDIRQDGYFEIPQEITSIAGHALYCCNSLQSIRMPKGLKFIGDGAFHCCTGLKTIVIPESVTSIGMNAFNGCRAMRSVTLPKGLQSIGMNAFGCCGNLQTIAIPQGVTSIASLTFDGCSALKIITIPESITSIGPRAINNYLHLHSIVISSKDQVAIKRITNLLPKDLHAKIVPFELAEEACLIREAQLARLAHTPETNPLYRFFYQKTGQCSNVRTENGAVKMRRTLPNNIFEAMNPFASNDSLYYQKALTRMISVPLPKNKDELGIYSKQIEIIATDCIIRSKEFNPHNIQSNREEIAQCKAQRVMSVCA
jgi:hypothetical protein